MTILFTICPPRLKSCQSCAGENLCALQHPLHHPSPRGAGCLPRLGSQRSLSTKTDRKVYDCDSEAAQSPKSRTALREMFFASTRASTPQLPWVPRHPLRQLTPRLDPSTSRSAARRHRRAQVTFANELPNANDQQWPRFALGEANHMCKPWTTEKKPYDFSLVEIVQKFGAWAGV